MFIFALFTNKPVVKFWFCAEFSCSIMFYRLILTDFDVCLLLFLSLSISLALIMLIKCSNMLNLSKWENLKNRETKQTYKCFKIQINGVKRRHLIWHTSSLRYLVQSNQWTDTRPKYNYTLYTIHCVNYMKENPSNSKILYLHHLDFRYTGCFKKILQFWTLNIIQ